MSREYKGLQVPDGIDDLLIDHHFAVRLAAGWPGGNPQPILDWWGEQKKIYQFIAKMLAHLESGDNYTLDDLTRPLIVTPLETGYPGGETTNFLVARQGTPPRGMMVVDIQYEMAWHLTRGSKPVVCHSHDNIAKSFIAFVKSHFLCSEHTS